MTLIINLLLINLFVCLVHEAGFFEYMDELVNKKYPLHHLPYLLMCGLCQTWWLSLLYVIITGNLSILTIALCLINAHLTKIVTPLYKLIENMLLKLIEVINNVLYL